MDFNKRIEECNSLDALFSLWKTAHGLESEESCCGLDDSVGTFPLKGDIMPNYMTFKDSFCQDGITSKAGVKGLATECQVMFILKEANVTEKDGTITKGNQDDLFWFNERVECIERKRYAERFQLVIQRLIQVQGLDIKDGEPYYYMNLNKRGGYGGSDNKCLRAYVKEYKLFIEKQIQLLSPSVIVCCGCYDLLDKALFGFEKHNKKISRFPQDYRSSKVFYVYHPSPINHDKRFNRGLDYIGQSKN